MIKIKKIRASSLRGLPSSFPDIVVGGNGMLVFGPNGSGKSSIVDAIEAAIGRDPIPFKNSGQGVTWPAGKKHVRYDNPTAALVLERTGVEYVVSTDGDGAQLPIEVETWTNFAKEALFVLRRSMLLQFIIEQPRDRYLRIEPFLDLVEFKRIEDELRKIVSEVDLAKTGFQQERLRLLSGLKELLGTEETKSPSDDEFVSSINKLLRPCGLPDVNTVQQFDEVLSHASAILKGNDLTNRINALSKVRVSLIEFKQLRIREEMDEYIRDMVALHSVEKWEWKVRISLLLEQGKALLENRHQDNCPLCEQGIPRLEILDKVTRRLDEASQIRDAQSKLSASKAKLLNSVDAVMRIIGRLVSDFSELKDIEPPAWINNCKTNINGFDWSQIEASLAIGNLEYIRNRWPYDEEIDTSIDLVGNVADEYGGNERLLALGRLIGALNFTIAERVHLFDLDKNLRLATTSLERSKLTYSLAERSRKDAVQEVFESISSTANHYFGAVHPGEAINNSELEIRDGTTGSVRLITNFYGRQCDPRLYLSESHQDTMGLCYYLALRKFEASQNNDFRLLVLDDVLHSVDSDHRARIASLIFDEFQDHQIIITTHDSVWFEYLKAQGRGLSRICFTGWSIDHGPIANEFPGLLEIVLSADARQGLSEQIICFSVGVVMEMICKQVAHRLEFSMPYDPKPTLGPLWDTVRSKLKQCAAYATLHTITLDAIQSDIWFRNRIGGHHNEDPAPITHAQSMVLANNVIAFYSSVFCSECKKYVIRQENSHWACPCGAIRYIR